jgi:hypothetical protein
VGKKNNGKNTIYKESDLQNDNFNKNKTKLNGAVNNNVLR